MGMVKNITAIKNFLVSIRPKYYPYLEIFKALLLVGFFLYGLSRISREFNLPLYPQSGIESVLLYTLVGFVFVSWLLGDRRRRFLILAYFVTFQIFGLAYVLRDINVIPRILTPIFLTYLSLFLFKSPEEFLIEREKKRQEELEREIQRQEERIRLYEETLREIQENYKRTLKEKRELEELYNSLGGEKVKKLLEEKDITLKTQEKVINELKEKIDRLKESNKELWELLEETLSQTNDKKGLREELRKLRRERKNLLRENLKLKEEIENLKLSLEVSQLEKEELGEKVERLEEILGENEKKLKDFEKALNRTSKGFRFLNQLFENIEFTDRALLDFVNLTPKAVKGVAKILKRLEREGLEKFKFESLEVPKGKIYKARFSGGRLYFSIKDGKIVVEGILEGESDKEKDRFIRSRFS